MTGDAEAAGEPEIAVEVAYPNRIRGRRVVGYVTALSLPAQPEPPTQQDTTAQLPCAAPDCGFLRTWLGMRGFQNRTKVILDGIQLTPSTIFCSR